MAQQSDGWTGRAAGQSRSGFPILFLVLIGLGLWSWPGGLWDIWSRAEAVLIQSAGGVLPAAGAPLPRWMCQVMLRLGGGAVSNWGQRLPSVLFGLLALALTFRMAAAWFGARVGWFAGLAFVTLAGLIGAVPAINPGMMLTAWIVLALDASIENWGRFGWVRWPVVVVFAGASFLTAGWPALLVLAAAMGTAWSRRAAFAAWVAAVAIACAVAATRIAVLTTLLVPVSFAVGHALARLSGKEIAPRTVRIVAVGALASTLAILILGLCLYFDPDFLWSRGLFVLHSGLFLLLLTVVGMLAVAAALWLRPRASSCIGAVLALLVMANVIVSGGLRPAMNPIRSGATISELLAQETARMGATIGAIGTANDPRLHVYGRYRVEKIAGKAGAVTKAGAPRLLLLTNRDAKDLDPALDAAGYVEVERVKAIGRKLVLLWRGAPVAVAPDKMIRLFALGDTGTGNRHQYAIGQRMGEVCDTFGPMTACLLLGDNVYENDALQAGLENRFLKPFDPLIKRKVPFYACLGNHDYVPIEKMKFELNTPWFNMGGRNYYEKTFGDGLMSVFFLDCETLRRDPEQYLWFKQELAHCHSAWKVLVNHVPMVASDVLHGRNSQMLDLYDEIMQDGKIDLVLSGHNHLYERRELRNGIQYLTVGCGGHVDRSFQFPEDNRRVIGYNSACCFSWMEVTRDRIHLRVRNEDGRPVDEFSLVRGKRRRLKVEEYPRPASNADETTGIVRTLTSH